MRICRDNDNFTSIFELHYVTLRYLFSQIKTLVLSTPGEQPIKINQVHFSPLKCPPAKQYFISKAGSVTGLYKMRIRVTRYGNKIEASC